MAVYYDINEKPARRVVATTYAGPRNELGEAVEPLAVWLVSWAPERTADITAAFATRPRSAEPPGEPVQARLFVEVGDAEVDERSLPEGCELVELPTERVATDLYVGPLSGLTPARLSWLRSMEAEHELEPGYRERIVGRGRSATDPRWEIELGVVLAGGAPTT